MKARFASPWKKACSLVGLASQLAGELAARSGWPRRDVYRLLLEIQNERVDADEFK